MKPSKLTPSLLTRLRLRYGMLWYRSIPNPFKDYHVHTWSALLAIITTVAVTTILTLHTTAAEADTKLQESNQHKNEYFEVVKQVMNGEVRMVREGEIFECTGGSLGSAELIKSSKGVGYMK